MTPLVSAVIAGFAMGIYLSFKGRFGPDHPLVSGERSTRDEARDALDDDGAPIALRRWVRTAMYPNWAGCTPLRASAHDSRELLAQAWSIRDEHDARRAIASLFSGPRTAWNRARIFLVAVEAQRAGYLCADETWAYCLRAKAELQSMFGSFDELARAYLAGRREWARLAADGSQDASDPDMAHHVRNAEHASRERWFGVDYGV